MRRPSSYHHRGVNSLTSNPGRRCSASRRARFATATELCAMVSTLSEVECIHPELGAQRAPELPRTIRPALEVIADGFIHGRLREQVPAAPPWIAQELHRRRATSIPQPVADGCGATFLVAPPAHAVGQRSIKSSTQPVLRSTLRTFDAV